VSSAESQLVLRFVAADPNDTKLGHIYSLLGTRSNVTQWKRSCAAALGKKGNEWKLRFKGDVTVREPGGRRHRRKRPVHGIPKYSNRSSARASPRSPSPRRALPSTASCGIFPFEAHLVVLPDGRFFRGRFGGLVVRASSGATRSGKLAWHEALRVDGVLGPPVPLHELRGEKLKQRARDDDVFRIVCADKTLLVASEDRDLIVELMRGDAH